MASTFNLRFSVSVEAFKSYVNLNQRITLNNFQIVLFRMVDLTITKANETPQYVEQERGQIQTLWIQDSMKGHNIGVL